ncbi:hypothetical protein [Vulcanisaeta sp. JCM 14467]|uniref:hypothetical protein n=1 Tax=Vulcanisaeta sp. JCM 14467 TaxID=1295370 RepID=UPI000AA9E525
MDSIDLRQLEEVVERAVKRAIEEARSEDMRLWQTPSRPWRITLGLAFKSLVRGLRR